jgi:hypothetical protein
MAESAGLRPLWLTYHSDKFVTVSPFKRSLINPYMTSRLDKRGGYIAQKKVLTLPDRWVGRPISTITFDDHGRQESIAAFHERRLRVACPDALVFDTSYACGGWGGRASEYYKAYLSLFLAHSVLFEDYHGGESGAVLGGFTNSVFEPAFKALKEQFGVRPLIVPLPWWPELAYYPDGEFLAGWRTEKAFAALATRLAA